MKQSKTAKKETETDNKEIERHERKTDSRGEGLSRRRRRRKRRRRGTDSKRRRRSGGSGRLNNLACLFVVQLRLKHAGGRTCCV